MSRTSAGKRHWCISNARYFANPRNANVAINLLIKTNTGGSFYITIDSWLKFDLFSLPIFIFIFFVLCFLSVITPDYSFNSSSNWNWNLLICTRIKFDLACHRQNIFVFFCFFDSDHQILFMTNVYLVGNNCRLDFFLWDIWSAWHLNIYSSTLSSESRHKSNEHACIKRDEH